VHLWKSIVCFCRICQTRVTTIVIIFSQLKYCLNEEFKSYKAEQDSLNKKLVLDSIEKFKTEILKTCQLRCTRIKNFVAELVNRKEPVNDSSLGPPYPYTWTGFSHLTSKSDIETMKSDIKTVSSKLDGLTLVIKDHIMTTIPVNPISPAKMKIKRKQTRDKIYKL